LVRIVESHARWGFKAAINDNAFFGDRYETGEEEESIAGILQLCKPGAQKCCPYKRKKERWERAERAVTGCETGGGLRVAVLEYVL
jgi:hypothetical protein